MRIIEKFLFYLLLLIWCNEINGQVHSVLDKFIHPFRKIRLTLSRGLVEATKSASYQRSLLTHKVIKCTHKDFTL